MLLQIFISKVKRCTLNKKQINIQKLFIFSSKIKNHSMQNVIYIYIYKVRISVYCFRNIK